MEEEEEEEEGDEDERAEKDESKKRKTKKNFVRILISRKICFKLSAARATPTTQTDLKWPKASECLQRCKHRIEHGVFEKNEYLC